MRDDSKKIPGQYSYGECHNPTGQPSASSLQYYSKYFRNKEGKRGYLSSLQSLSETAPTGLCPPIKASDFSSTHFHSPGTTEMLDFCIPSMSLQEIAR